jgi:hypothetical protein
MLNLTEQVLNTQYYDILNGINEMLKAPGTENYANKLNTHKHTYVNIIIIIIIIIIIMNYIE